MSSLPTPLRRQLESAIKQARTIAESGARKALETLAVHEPDPYPHMNEAQRDLRRKLRAQAKQLGDGESRARRGAYEIKHLAEKLAYDQWHRLLFARYLLENDLLISPEHQVAVSLDDCEELASSLGLKDSWSVAAQFASKELPEIFRADDPAGSVDLAIDDRLPLIQLVTGLPEEVFTAGDSLGWCYQFWQAERKDEVNASGNKIGADELPAVTQLFTEDYMVDFLLDNTLGAWHAGKYLAAHPALAGTAATEGDLRSAMALPGCPWTYLRFIQKDGKWTPAAGTFDGWPKAAKDLKCLDPCMGSGHFVVAMFERLVALRMAEENGEESDMVAAVIRDNLFGLEIDPRCTQIGAFNLALVAWKRIGHCALPPVHIACSGIAPNAKLDDWLSLAGGDERLQNGMDRLYRLFKDAPVLGSLINPRAAKGDLYEATFHELQPLLEKALAQETKDDTAHEMAVTARGLAKAAEILAGQFTLIATNVPYLGRPKQDEILTDYCERVHPEAKADLATCFVERSLDFCTSDGTATLVTPQNWLSQPRYKNLRERMLRSVVINWCFRLGEHAFESPQAAGAFVALVSLSRSKLKVGHQIAAGDFAEATSPAAKSRQLILNQCLALSQAAQAKNPEGRVEFSESETTQRLMKFTKSIQGLATSDDPQFTICFWELPAITGGWCGLMGTVLDTIPFGGREQLILWEDGRGRYFRHAMALKVEGRMGGWKSGTEARGKRGVLISQMRQLPVTLYLGEFYDHNACVFIPEDPSHLTAIWAFCESEEFNAGVRTFDQALKPSNNTLTKVSFDLSHWQKVAAEKYPNGLPKPFSSDPTQWLFKGHPAGADQPLHVAVARLLGYQWPRQTGSSFPDCPPLGFDGLEPHSDDDGIVCLSATKGEAPAAERLRSLLAEAMGTFDLKSLLVSAGPKGSNSESLDAWLRDEFFEQHCALFHNSPFIWHIWDGHKSGFSAFVNYHKLTHANLETLTYAYLGDWIRRQQAAVDAGEGGSDARLQAAKQLQARLKLILGGEPPFDLFVRWKPLSEQAIGWHPDLNDGVRMNIRPFLAQDIPGGKKGAGILRTKPNIKWDKDRGKEPMREKSEYPWFWGWDEQQPDFAGVGKEPDGNRWNDCHYTNDFKRRARTTK
jgi:hypothetical protein